MKSERKLQIDTFSPFPFLKQLSIRGAHLSKVTWTLINRPSVWAVFYFAAVPLFAYIYSYQSRGFYHTTVIHEKQLTDDLEEIRSELETRLRVSFRSKHGSDFLEKGKIRFDVYTMQISNLRVENQHLVFDLAYEFVSLSPEWHEQVPVSIENIILSGPFQEGVYSLLDQGVLNQNRSFWLGELWPGDGRAVVQTRLGNTGQISGTVEIADKTTRKIRAYIETLQGLPWESSSNYSRMLYLSVVTITTLGYGDIVPITPEARFFVGAEAVLGIIVAGLFLSAVAKSARHEREDGRGQS